MIKGKLPPVQEDSYLQFDENEEAKYQKFLSPPSKNKYESTQGKKMPRRSTLGISNFNPHADSSPSGDRFIPKRRGQDSNIAMYEINHEDSPPMNIEREDFDNSWEYEESKAEYTQKIEYESVLKEAFFGTNSPNKENGEDYVEANLFSSPQKAEGRSNLGYKKKLLNFKSKSSKENQPRVIRNKTLRLNDFRSQNLQTKPAEKITKIYPERVLDAPNMVDDFYLNLLDWSGENVLAIALEN